MWVCGVERRARSLRMHARRSDNVSRRVGLSEGQTPPKVMQRGRSREGEYAAPCRRHARRWPPDVARVEEAG